MNNNIPKVVLTGGPCAGKSTILSRIQESFPEQVETVPEAANMLIGGGFPLPSDSLPYSERWQMTLQDPLFTLQQSLEANHSEIATRTNKQLLVCDRGLLDQVAYFRGGVSEFLERYKVSDVGEIIGRYSLVIHLASVALLGESAYQQASSAQERVEDTVEQVREAEQKTLEAWSLHPNLVTIEPNDDFQTKVKDVLKIIDEQLRDIDQGGQE